MSKETMNIAIVGCGQIVTHHVTALSNVQNTNIRVKALCDPSMERRAIIKELCKTKGLIDHDHDNDHDNGFAEFATLDELLNSPSSSSFCPVIFIAVPHDLHVSIASMALRAGKHVVLEKPLAPTLQGCRQLLSLSQQQQDDDDDDDIKGGMLIVAEQSPYWQEVSKAKELIQNNAIGTLVSAASYYYESMRDNVTSGVDDTGGLGWRCSLERCGGGIVIDGGLHWIRPLREMCGGNVESVVGVTQNCDLEGGLKLEGETLAHAILKIGRGGEKENGNEFESGSNHASSSSSSSSPLLATYSANMMHTAPMAHDACPYFRLTGTKGELVIAGTGLFVNGGGGLRLYNDEHPDGKDLFPVDRQGGFFLGFRGLWEAVVEIWRTDDREAAKRSVREAASDVAVALAIYKSSKSGQWEPCDIF